jgi:hypothetical protein
MKKVTLTVPWKDQRGVEEGKTASIEDTLESVKLTFPTAETSVRLSQAEIDLIFVAHNVLDKQESDEE